MSEITSAVELWLPEADSREQTLITHEVDQQAAQKTAWANVWSCWSASSLYHSRKELF